MSQLHRKGKINGKVEIQPEEEKQRQLRSQWSIRSAGKICFMQLTEETSDQGGMALQ